MNIPSAIALSRFTPFGPVTLLRLWKAFPNLEEVFLADLASLTRAGVDTATLATFIHERGKLNPEHEARRVRDAGISVTALDDPSYPTLLKEIPTPPLLLYHRGRLPKNILTAVAVVGTRLASPYGRAAALSFASNLARNDIVIVSGLAIGIDTIAHEATLEAGGTTIAVLAHGLDMIYPPENRLLAERIVEHGGALMSEFPLGHQPLRQNFPMRNRIIAGLSKATLVVEGKHTSGALITAREALEQNREVFAIPGDITRQSSEGPNALIAAGAHVALSPDDILNALALSSALPLPSRELELEAKAKTIFAHLDKTPKSVDDVMHIVRAEAGEILAIITELELQSLVRDVGGGMYVKI